MDFGHSSMELLYRRKWVIVAQENSRTLLHNHFELAKYLAPVQHSAPTNYSAVTLDTLQTLLMNMQENLENLNNLQYKLK